MDDMQHLFLSLACVLIFLGCVGLLDTLILRPSKRDPLDSLLPIALLMLLSGACFLAAWFAVSSRT